MVTHQAHRRLHDNASSPQAFAWSHKPTGVCMITHPPGVCMITRQAHRRLHDNTWRPQTFASIPTLFPPSGRGRIKRAEEVARKNNLIGEASYVNKQWNPFMHDMPQKIMNNWSKTAHCALFGPQGIESRVLLASYAQWLTTARVRLLTVNWTVKQRVVVSQSRIPQGWVE